MVKKSTFADSRLPRFSDKWEVSSLGNLGKLYGGLSNKTKADFQEGNSLYVPFINVMNNVVVDVTNLGAVKIQDGENQKMVNAGDLLFTGSSETPREVGMCAVLLKHIDNLYLNSFCFGFRIYDTKKHSPLFLSYLINSDTGRDVFQSYARGTTRYNLSKLDFSKIQFSLPSTKAEQNAIAEVLADIDSWIESLRRLVQKKRDIKTAAMQELLTGNTRLPGFAGKWKLFNLGELVRFIRGKGLSKSKLAPQGNPCILYGELFTSYKEIIRQVASKTPCKEGTPSISGDILMPGSTTTVGIDLAIASALLLDSVLLGGDVQILRAKKDNYDSVFLSHYLRHEKKREIEKSTQGITIIHLNCNNLADMPLLLPPTKAEQTAIANLLADMDADIAAQERLLEKAKYVKIAKMQELLTGKTRLPASPKTPRQKRQS